MLTTETSPGKKHLTVLNNVSADPAELDIDAELKKFELEQMKALGLEPGREHWRDDNPTKFTASQRTHTTILISGLTMAHDLFLQGGLRGIGYKVEAIDCPDTAALQLGKEFGNRGQCNPTYFTVGNLVKYLTYLRDEKKIPTKEIVDNYLFVTAGACGPCRFGTYVTEYRKALRDSGFDGFRVILFQQQGGLKQATGEAQGLEMNPKFFLTLLGAIMMGDALNALTYRIRPYEVVKGATDEALAKSKQQIHDALAAPSVLGILNALIQTRRNMMNVKVDRTIAKPKVSIIGEFWAMTTEGDGNYGLQRFLEQEGAECDIQLVTAWILFMIWEQRWDTEQRMVLRAEDKSRKGLVGVNARKKVLMLAIAEKAVRGAFWSLSQIIGLHDYHLTDMQMLSDVSKDFYNNHLRGGEAHMEVGKLIVNVMKNKATMTLSVKPFGCMPSSGVSDGVQSYITEKYPQAIFCPIETNGDGAVNVYSRVQMMLFKARQAAKAELDTRLGEAGVTIDEVKSYLEAKTWRGSSLFYPRHEKSASMAASVVEHVAPDLKKTLKKLAAKGQRLVRAAAPAPVASGAEPLRAAAAPAK
jgi:predicted nucleotide-binding protein (sugar kinase/HSP70/actin superfamily)